MCKCVFKNLTLHKLLWQVQFEIFEKVKCKLSPIFEQEKPHEKMYRGIK